MASYCCSRSGSPHVLGSTLVAIAWVSAAIAADADTCDGLRDASDICSFARSSPRSPTKTRASFIQHQANMHPISLVEANREYDVQDDKVANDDVGDGTYFREAAGEVPNTTVSADDAPSSTTDSSVTSSGTTNTGLPTDVQVKVSSPIVVGTTSVPANDTINGSKSNSSSNTSNAVTKSNSVSSMTTNSNKSNNSINTTDAVASINNRSTGNSSNLSAIICVTQETTGPPSKWYTTSPPGTPCVFGVDVLDEGWHCIMEAGDPYGDFGWCWTGKNSWGSCSEDCPSADDISEDSTFAPTTLLSQAGIDNPGA
eukprot:TRINITY_DN69894_c0_g1_i1.p1 TRINITY_DN69894_c0_g1~~TRINITY_DN69894_c0_g1_i1.p1  ORF type:complete len:332 (-),score=64.03 TRINITY_DN69894_c0_g1_i1:274-1212(-)